MQEERNETISQAELLQILTGLKHKADAASAQIVNLGFLVEYLYEELNKQGVEIPMEGYADWAEKRFAELQKAAEQAQKAGLMDDLNQSTSKSEINLEE